MKVEVDVLGLPVPNKPTVSVDVRQHFNNNFSPSLTSLMVSVDVKHHVYLLIDVTTPLKRGQ